MAPTSPADRRSRDRADRAARTKEILDRLASTSNGSQHELTRLLIEINMPVAKSIASRFRRRGIPEEDLEQVAYLALVRVASSYDRSRGSDFLAYAVPSIRGEVRRYFRDHGWMVKPPRSIQEMQGRIASVESQLATRLGHPPTSREIADELDAALADVEEARAANGCFSPTSLDQMPGSAARAMGIVDRLGEDDPGLEAVEARVLLGPALRLLPSRDRRILELRFVSQRTQQEIADEIGVTQWQVSRLLAGLLDRLRTQLAAVADVRVAS